VNDPIAVSGVAKVPPRPAPDVGQHTREVLASLGYSDPEIASLLARRIAIQA
jgi:formyl-CoA transferase